MPTEDRPPGGEGEDTLDGATAPTGSRAVPKDTFDGFCGAGGDFGADVVSCP